MALGLAAMGSLMDAKAQTLQEAMGEAMASNPKIMAAISDYRASEERVNQAYSGYWPKIDGRLGTGKEWTSSPTTRFGGQGGTSLERGEMGLSISQMLFDGLNTYNRVDQSQAQSRSSGATLRKTINQITLETVEVYLETLKLEQMLSVDEEAIAVLEQIVIKMDEMNQIGMGTQTDADQSRSRLVMAKSERSATTKRLNDAKAKFIEVTGSAPTNLKLPDIRRDWLPATLNEALNQALRRAPGILITEAEMDAVDAEKKMSVASLLPRVNLEMNLGDDANTSGVASYTKSASAMVRMEYNLFRGGGDWFHHRELANKAYKSQEDMQQARRQTTKELTSYWHQVEIGAEQMAFLESNVAVKKRIANAYQEEHALGTRSHLDALNALNDVATAKRSLVEEKFKHRLAICQILSSMGVLEDVLTRTDAPFRPHFLTRSPSGERGGRAPEEKPGTTNRHFHSTPVPAIPIALRKSPPPITDGDLLHADALILANADLLFPLPTHDTSTLLLADLAVADLAVDAAHLGWASLAERTILDYIRMMERPDSKHFLLRPYTLQVGEFLHEERAEAVVNQLTHSGYEVFLRELRDTQGRIRQLVWVGHYPSRLEAEAALVKLRKRTGVTAIVALTAIPVSRTPLSLSRIKPPDPDRLVDENETILLGMILDQEKM
ncbi:MAG: TolC family outer membrane protein [Magnetococcales bacterium]|nr:TolC family outer membrane protein [Magnetococcales bacterium]